MNDRITADRLEVSASSNIPAGEMRAAVELAPSSIKARVRAYWDQQPCGSNFRGSSTADPDFFSRTEDARYKLDGDLIFGFAQFPRWHGRVVLEVGVGMGTDFIQWLRSGALATGIDLSPESVTLATRRAANEGFQPSIQVADAEDLPFPDDHFDLVYSWGVLHHTADTQAAIDEVHRVLKPGGAARIMLYHRYSWTTFSTWLSRGLQHGKIETLSEALAEGMESPGTRAFSLREAYGLFAKFSSTEVSPRLTAYDTVAYTNWPEHRRGPRSLKSRLRPVRLIGLLGDRLGWNLLIRAQK